MGACGSSTAIDATLTMAPRVAASAATAACETRKVVLRLIAISRSKSWTSVRSMGPYVVSPPARLTTTSSRPNARWAISTARAAISGSVRSPAQGRASMPAAANSRARSATPTALRSATTSLAPARPNARATALPIWPARPTPVTSTTRSRKSNERAIRTSGCRRRRRHRRTGRLERLEPPQRNVLRAERPVSLVADRVAVPVAAAGAPEAQVEGEFGEPGADVRIVARVPGFHRIEPGLPEVQEHAPAAAILEVGGGDHAAHPVHEVGDLGEAGQRLLHERGPAPAQVPVERFPHAGHLAPAEEGPSHVRPAHGPALGLREHVLVAHRDAQPVEPIHHGPAPARSVGPAVGQEGFQDLDARREEIAEYVHLAPGRRDRELAATHHPYAQPRTGRDGRGHAADGVVVGQRHGRESGARGPAHHRLGGQLAVRGGRVDMEVDDRAPGTVTLGHARYSVSGAVQAGCEWASSERSCASVSSESASSELLAPRGEYRTTRRSRAGPVPRANTSPSSSFTYCVTRPLTDTIH